MTIGLWHRCVGPFANEAELQEFLADVGMSFLGCYMYRGNSRGGILSPADFLKIIGPVADKARKEFLAKDAA